jgi:hypothetical protein
MSACIWSFGRVQLAAFFVFAMIDAPVWGDTLYSRRAIQTGYTVEVLAQAQPDEYFFGLGDPRNAYVSGGVDMSRCYVEPGNLPRPKVNEAYVWSLARSGKTLYFGTVANASILVAGNYFGYLNPAESFLQAAEYQLGVYGQTNGLPSYYADWRPPRICRFDTVTRSMERVDTTLPAAAQADLHTLEGLRAGGAVPPTSANPRGLVVLAGPPLRQDLGGGVGFFFFDGTDGAFLGSVIKPEYCNIRRFATLNGDLYAGVQNTLDGSGTVIRLVNSRRNPRFPLVIEEVGDLDQAGADIAVHDGRLFITTWPGYIEGGSTNSISMVLEYVKRATGLWMSPPVPATGLKSLHRKQWAKVWNATQYEPDLLVSITYGGGALCSFDGWLYFGTMHVPTIAAAAFFQVYPLPPMPVAGTPEYDAWVARQTAIYANTDRVTSLFRGRNFFIPRTVLGIPSELGGEIQLLSGYHTMPVYDRAGDSWVTTTNRMNQAPRMSGPGYDAYNAYTWCMSVFKNNLYIGTVNPDVSAGRTEAFYRTEFARPETTWGGDLLMIPSSLAARFEVVSRNGLGNPLNYGFRTMAATEDELFIGTANANNMQGDFADNMPDGGWELLRLTKRDPTPFDLDGDYIADPAWVLPGSGSLALGSAGPSIERTFGVAFSRPAWADYDGDGRMDPGWFVPGTGQWLADLSTRDGERMLVDTTTGTPSGALPVPADYDGDGQADPAWCDVANGQLFWRGKRDGKVRSMTLDARASALPAVADYDGDHLADPAWYIPARGEWVLQLSRNGKRTTVCTRLVRKGIPVPADYDGDGRADFAVHNPATGEIQVWIYSSGNPPFLTSEGLGAAWRPMPGDYDGDGRADFAWYHDSSQMLRIRYAAGTAESFAVPEVSRGVARPVATPLADWFPRIPGH